MTTDVTNAGSIAQTPRATLSWDRWRQAVVDLLRTELADTQPRISLDDVDWPAWQRFFEDGRTPRSAVDRALERDL